MRIALRIVGTMLEFVDHCDHTCLLCRFGMSWQSDVLPLCDETGCIQTDHLQRLSAVIRASDFSMPTRKEMILSGGSAETNWPRYFGTRIDVLYHTLDYAINSGLPVKVCISDVGDAAPENAPDGLWSADN